MQQTLPPVKLTPAERRHLRRLLARHFELDELRDLAFDLGAEYTVFHQDSRRAFCRAWIASFESQGRVRCLAAAARERTQEPDAVLENLLARLPACAPWPRLQVILGEGQQDVGELLGDLAKRLRITPDEIVLVTAVRGSVRLLVSVPAGAAGAAAPTPAVLAAPAALAAAGGAFAPFETLEALDQHAWRWVAQTWPPVVTGGVLQPVALWEEALDAVRATLMQEGLRLIQGGQSLAQAGEYEPALQSLERALEIARELQDADMEATVLGHLGNTRYVQGQIDQAMDRYRQALDVAREIACTTGDRRTESIHLGNLGVAYYAQGQTQAAIAYYQRALGIARQAGDLRTEGTLLGNLGLAYSALTRTAQSSAAAHSTAVDYYQQALAIAREVAREAGDRRAEERLLGHLGDAYRGMGETPGAGGTALRRANLYTAADTYHRALVIAREVGDLRSEGDLLSRLGNTCLSLGELGDRQYHTAIEYYEQALDIARKARDCQSKGARLGNLGSAYFALGQFGQALDTYQQALDIAREVGDRKGEGVRLGNLGNAYYALALGQREGEACGLIPDPSNPSGLGLETGPGKGRPADGQDHLHAAVDAYRQALDIAREVGDRRAEGVHLAHLGLVYCALSDLRGALSAPAEAPEPGTLPQELLGEPQEPLGESQEPLLDAQQPFSTADDLIAGAGPPEELAGPTGYCRAAIAAFERALDIAREVGDRKAEGFNLGCLGDAYSALGQAPGAHPRDRRPAAARECYRQALAIAREVGDRRAEAHHLGRLGSVYGDLGEREQAIAALEQALIVAREIGDRQAEASHLGGLGEAYSASEQCERARTYFQQAVSVAHDLGDRRCEGNWLGDLAGTYSATGQYELAVRCYDRALEIAREIGDRENEATWLGNMGNAYVTMREVPQGIAAYEEALPIVRALGDRRNQEGLLGNLGNAYSVLRQWDKAAAAYESALATARETGHRRGEGIWLLNLSLTLYEQGRREEAIAQATAARDVLEAACSPEAAQATAMLERWTEQK